MKTRSMLAVFSSILQAVVGLHAGEMATHFHEPFCVEVDGARLDTSNRLLGGYFDPSPTSPGDTFGHAAPYFADLDDDGRRDLVLGSYAGRFRWYSNSGTDAAPLFERNFTWLQSGGEPAQVCIYCCVASGPQLVDIDGDGILDLTSGSYDPGAVYWFKGLGRNGQYAPRQMLTHWTGVPIFSHLEKLATERWASFASAIAWGDFNGDGKLDLVLGNYIGELKLYFYLRPETGLAGVTAIRSQPVFSEDAHEIRIEGAKAIDEEHSAPTVADWDNDGLLDILVGTDTGAVYYFRNSGTAKKPEFKSRELLIPAGEGVEQWLEPGQLPRRGIRAQIQAVDYNRDGKLDLLVGDWSYTMTPRPDLTKAEREKLDAIQRKLAALDQEVRFPYYNWRHKWVPYEKRPELLAQAQSLCVERAPYLVRYGTGDAAWACLQAHGQVWVFMRK